jgi:hypothetical protein
VKYLILIYGNPANWEHPLFLQTHEPLPPDERDGRVRRFGELMEEVAASGELVDSAALADPLTARTLRVHGGALTVTDGPFPDAKEHLAGYFVVDCDSIERAVELAARFPDVVDGTVVVRPIMDLSGMEM